MLKRFGTSALAVLTVLGACSGAWASAAGGAIKNPAANWQHLWDEMLLDITIIGVVFALIIIYLLIRYRRTQPDQEGNPPVLSLAAQHAWVLIPVFLFMADDLFLAARGWNLWNDYRSVPAGSYEVELKAQMWSFNFKHPNGVEESGTLHVEAGKPVVVRMTSADVVHSMFIPDFKVKEDSMPGRVTYLWFYPEKSGEHVITCAEYCGMMHSGMHGKVIAMPKDQFQAWADAEKAKIATANAEGGKS
ncbi:MAG: cytochrome c oxidase subunit II [Deltaproteobacteria bacterium]|nr:cytochrome c oxidase subunit II [Deltaproteobacteria bacterium]